MYVTVLLVSVIIFSHREDVREGWRLTKTSLEEKIINILLMSTLRMVNFTEGHQPQMMVLDFYVIKSSKLEKKILSWCKALQTIRMTVLILDTQ